MMRARLAAALLLLAAVGGGWLVWQARGSSPQAAGVPAAGPVFVNETADHRYDRSMLASIGIFQRATGIQLGLVLKQQLPARTSIEAHAAELFQKAGLGRASGANAVLLLWAQAERQFKIEVSYGLEAVFPDLLCQQLEEAARSYMLSPTPYARRDFLTELMVTMREHYLQSRQAAAQREISIPQFDGAYALSSYLSGGAGFVGRDYAGALDKARALQAPLPAGVAQKFAPQKSAEQALRLYLLSLEEGAGFSGLPLLTEGSRYFRMEKPHTAAYSRRVAAYYQKALPYTLWEQGELAVARFQPGQPVLPVFLRKDAQGLWRVDEAKGPAYFQLPEQGGAAVAKYAGFPYAKAWLAGNEAGGPHAGFNPLFADRSASPALLGPAGLRDHVAALEQRVAANPESFADVLSLAEVLHFEMYWLEAAGALYERALVLKPERNDIRWRLLDVYINTSDVDAQEGIHKALASQSPDDALARHYYNWFKQVYPLAAGASRRP